MIEGVMPYLRVKAAERSESVGNADEAAMLCISPRQWPASCAATPLRVSISSSSGMSAVRTRSSTCAVCKKRQAAASRITSLQMRIEALMISPVAGSTHEGPIAFSTCEGT